MFRTCAREAGHPFCKHQGSGAGSQKVKNSPAITICKRVRPAAVSGCFLLLCKVVKDEYVTDFALHRGGGGGHRTGNSVIGDSPEES